MNFFRNTDWDWETSVDQADERQMEDVKTGDNGFKSTNKSKKFIKFFVVVIVFLAVIGFLSSVDILYSASLPFSVRLLCFFTKIVGVLCIVCCIGLLVFSIKDRDSDNFANALRMVVLGIVMLSLDKIMIGLNLF